MRLFSPISSEKAARTIMMGGLAREELEFIMSITAPLFWITRTSDTDQTHSGSVFFLQTGIRLFAVTALHVIDAYYKDCSAGKAGPLCMGSGLEIDLAGRNSSIAGHKDIDIATFAVTADEVASIDKFILTGYQHDWPPLPPKMDKGVIFGGYAGVETEKTGPRQLSFGKVAGHGVATSISERDVSSQLERGQLLPVFGQGVPPVNYDFGGLSGGPMLTVVEKHIRGWALSGVIYQGPNTSNVSQEAIEGLEIIKARRAHFILPDGTLDECRWELL